MDSSEMTILGVIGLAILVMFTGVGIAIHQTSVLYDHCIADGHKDYECVGIVGGRR